MADYRAPLQDMRFVLFDVFQSELFWKNLLDSDELDRVTADAILDEAAKILEQEVAPLNRPSDEQGCKLVNDAVRSPDGFKAAYEAFSEGGWGALGGDLDYGAMGMPKSFVCVVEEMLQGACMSFGLAPMLTAGACLALNAHGSEALKSTYLPKMYSGQWSGAMDLTEPHAGTDLGLIRTKAVPTDDGAYHVTGSKIFITWGDHDMAENIIHLVLAKLPDAPSGSKGISLFLVPKFLPDGNGEKGERNPVYCGALEKKMGIHASATCVMNFDGAKGWLVGELNKGLMCMFTMMNYERLVVGIQAVGAAEMSYQTGRDYAFERTQGRSPEGVKSPEKEADSLIVHPDIRRMLMTIKANNEASRAFYVYVAQWLDKAKYTQDKVERQKAQNRVALLTPVAKAFISDMAFESAVTGQQIMGGHGYIREWGQEQLVRDIRITQIYEGTNGVQAMDLMGRKTIACKGALLAEFISEIIAFKDDNQQVLDALSLAESLQEYLTLLQAVTQKVIENSDQNPNEVGAAAVEYLNLLGLVSYSYMWAKMACAAEPQRDTAFMDAKIKTCQFYFSRMLPQARGLAESICNGSDTIMGLSTGQF